MIALDLPTRLRIASELLRSDGLASVPALLEEAAAALATPAPAAGDVVGVIRVTNWPTGPEFHFEPDRVVLTLPVGEYQVRAGQAITKARR